MGRRRAKGADIHGLLVVDKPLGWSSMDVVRRVRRAAGNAKTGHAGTLDPLATGVVVCCLGRGTKCVDQLMGLQKVYLAELDLSAFTTTDDREGPREEISRTDGPPDEAEVAATLPRFVGEISQTPPAYSAIHVDGQRAYKLARQGETVKLEPRTVRIDAIELLAFAWPIATVRVHCGKGTYIRSLARDIGIALGAGGHLASLRREAVGPYTLDRAVSEDRLESPIVQQDLLPLPQ